MRLHSFHHTMSNTIQISRAVCRIGYSHKDITVSVENDATEDQICAAVLHAAGGEEFSEHSVEYELTFAPALQEDRSRKTLAMVLQTLADLGFGTDLPIAGADAVDAIAAIFNNLAQHLDGTGIEIGLMHSESENGFWSNTNGWGQVSDATLLFDRNLTLVGIPDARFVPRDKIATFGRSSFTGPTGLTLADALDKARAELIDAEDISSLSHAFEILHSLPGDHQEEIASISAALLQ